MRNDLVSRKAVMASLVKEYNRQFAEGNRGGLKLAWIEKAVDDVYPVSEEELTKYLKPYIDDGR